MAGNNTNAAVILYTLVKDSDRHEKTLQAHTLDISELKVTVSTLGAKLSVYAALGSTIGGAVMALMIHLLTK